MSLKSSNKTDVNTTELIPLSQLLKKPIRNRKRQSSSEVSERVKLPESLSKENTVRAFSMRTL